MAGIAVNGVRLSYHEWPGSGPTLLCVHGISANCRAWDCWAEQLAPAYRVIALDLRGRGRSDKPPAYPVEVHRDLGCYPRDLDAVIDALGLEAIHFLGPSLGAMIGVVFAATYPRRVRKLILVDGGHDLRPDVTAAIRPALDRLGVTFASVKDYLARMQALPFFSETWNRHLDCYFRYDVESRPDGSVCSRASRAAVETDAATWLSRSLASFYRQITAPTLILQAPEGLLTDSDCILSREEGEQLTAAIPDARLVTVAGVNHYTILFARNPEVIDKVQRFLAA